jgi:hypothetical protein
MLYRWVAVWVLVALCASYGEVGLVVSLGIVAIILTVAAVGQGIILLIQGQSNQDWQDRDLPTGCSISFFGKP